MDKAAAEEKRRKAASENRKRPSSGSNDTPDNKRIKLESEPSVQSTSAAFLSAFDFTSLPAPLITNLIVANLEAFTEAQLISLVNAYRQARGMPTSSPTEGILAPSTSSVQGVVPPAPSVPTGPRAGRSSEQSSTPQPHDSATDAAVVKEEPVDPLKMDIDEDELEYEPERLNEEV